MNFYHPFDPAVIKEDGFHRPGIFRGAFMYMHGAAEDIMSHVEKENGWDWNPPDIFCCDQDIQEAGIYFGMLYGNEVVLVVSCESKQSIGTINWETEEEDWEIRDLFSGRAALLHDVPALEHCMKPEAWA